MNLERDVPVDAALSFDHLTKQFDDLVAVDDVSLDVPEGAFFGLVGPNGAGKTTLLSMAVGLIRPDAGSSRVLDADVWTDPVAAKSALGVLPEAEYLPRRLTGTELLTSIGALRGMAPDVIRARTAELLDVIGLAGATDTLVADFSTGMGKKIALAVALLHGPRVLVLDEPLESVDPVSAATIRSILNSFVGTGGTILFSSHVMASVETLCDHVAVMHEGRIIAAGTLQQVCAGEPLETAFSRLVGAEVATGTLSWFES